MILTIDTKYIGSFRKTHGVCGQMLLMTENPITEEQLRKASFLFLKIDGGQVPFKIESIQKRDTDCYILSFEDIEDKNTAESLINKRVYIEKNLLFEKEENTEKNDFQGFLLIDQKGKEIGHITGHCYEMPENPLFELDNGKLLIPIHEELFISVDYPEKIIHYQVHEGLTDL